VIIPFEQLSPAALKGLIEEFVTRPGTDTGYTRKTLGENVEMVKRQLRQGDVLIAYDAASQTANIVPKAVLDRLKDTENTDG
jgi:uncharacterized protein